MREFTDESGTYRIENMEPETAFHVVRKLLPLLEGFSSLASLQDNVLAALSPTDADKVDPASAKQTQMEQLDQLTKALKPLANVLAEMSDKHIEFVMHTCLAHVKKMENNAAVALWNARAGRYQFQLKLPTMLTLVGLSIMENAGDFFPGKG